MRVANCRAHDKTHADTPKRRLGAMKNRRRFRLTATQGKVWVYENGKLLEDTFDLSPRDDLIFFLRSASLPSTEIEQILSDLATKGSVEFRLD